MIDEAAAAGLPEASRTRPGTAMIGPYSVHQMDDFPASIAHGEIRPSGIMNILQRLYIAEHCPPDSMVVDVCCGRGLQLPTLYRYRPDLVRYVGLDISTVNLAQARDGVERLDAVYGERPFPVELVECDVAQVWPALDADVFDVAVYTSALEHLPRERGVASLGQAASHVRPGGVLFLSTPTSRGSWPRPLQHRVHVYEWDPVDLEQVLVGCGLDVVGRVGLVAPEAAVLERALGETFGTGALAWYQALRQCVPPSLLDAVSTAALPQAAAEVLYVCRRLV